VTGVGVVAAGAGIAVGLALTIDLRLGAALALGALVVPLALLDLPVVIALWAALTVFSRIPGLGLTTSAAGLLVLGAWIAHARTDRAAIRSALRLHRPLLAVVTLLLVWLTLSRAWAQDQAAAASALLDWYINAAALVVVLTSLRTARDVLLVIGAVILAVLAALGLALAGIELAPAQLSPDLASAADGRLTGALGDPNFMAAIFLPVLVLCAAMRGAVSTPARSLLLPAAIFLAVGLAMTQSRGGLLAAVATLVAALVFMRGHRAAVLGVGAAAVVTVAVYLLANPAALGRLQSIGEDRGNGREDLWLVARRMSADHPVGGVGLANFTVRSREYVRRPGTLRYVELVVERPHVVHNSYLQLLAETGVVGFMLFLAFAWSAVASAVRAGRRFERAGDSALALLSRGVVAANIGLLTAAIFISVQTTSIVWVLLAFGPLLLGVAALRRDEPTHSRARAPLRLTRPQ
jgi:O-antigen ligase